MAILAFAALAPSQLRAQPAHSLTLRPSITLVGINDDDCHEAAKQLQRFIGEFPFVRGHRIYVVCDSAAWQSVLHHFTLEYGVIVNSRAAFSDIRLRETWFYATALRAGSDGKPGEYIYAHELGHFVCSCIDEAVAHKAAVQLLNEAHSHSQAPVRGVQYPEAMHGHLTHLHTVNLPRKQKEGLSPYRASTMRAERFPTASRR